MMLKTIESIRAQANAIMAACDALIEAATRIEKLPPPCLHPKERRVESSVMGEPPQFICQACGVTVQLAAENKEE